MTHRYSNSVNRRNTPIGVDHDDYDGDGDDDDDDDDRVGKIDSPLD
jgi:hypothetical protein